MKRVLVALVLAALIRTAAPAAAQDTSPPVLGGPPTIVPGTVDVSETPQTVRIEARLIDNVGVTGVLFNLVLPNRDGETIQALPALVSGTHSDGLWRADVSIPRNVNGELPLAVFAHDAALNALDDTTAVVLTVTGGDIDPPTAGPVMIAPDHVDLSAGPVTVTVTATLEDAESGLHFVAFHFLREDEETIASNVAERISGTPFSGTWRAEIEIPENAPSGSHPLLIDMMDVAGNTARITTSARLMVEGGDADPPSLVGAIGVEPDTLGLTGSGGIVTVTAALADSSGVESMYAELRDAEENMVAYGYGEITAGDSLSGTWTAAVEVPPETPDGVYPVVVIANDRLLNFVEYAAGISVTLTHADVTAPEIEGPVTIEPDTVDVTGGSAVVTVGVAVRDNLSGVSAVAAVFRKGQADSLDGELSLVGGTALAGNWGGAVTIPQGAPAGSWALVIAATDSVGNRVEKVTGLSLVVQVRDVTPPALSGTASIEPDSLDPSGGARDVTVLFRLVDAASGVAEARVELRPSGPGITLEASAARISGDSLDGRWRSVVTVPAGSPEIVLSLWIVARDHAANEATIPTGQLLHITPGAEAPVTFRVDMRPLARPGLFRPDLGMKIWLDVFDGPSTGLVRLNDADRDTIYDGVRTVRSGAAIRYAFAFDPGVSDSSLYLYEKNGRNGGRELTIASAAPVTLPAVRFDDRAIPPSGPPAAALITRFFGPHPSPITFDKEDEFTDVTLSGISAPAGGVAAVRRYTGGGGGAAQEGIAVLSTAVYWGLSSFGGASPVSAAIEVPFDLYGGVTDPTALRWLFRAAPGEPWRIVATVLEEGTARIRSVAGPVDGEWTIGSTTAANPLTPTPPGIPAVPNPPDGAFVDETTTSLAWLPAANALSYTAWLWPDGSPRPHTPTYRGAAPQFDVLRFEPLTHWRWQVTAANRTGLTEGPVWMFHVDSAADLVIDRIEAPPEAFAGQEIEIRFVIRNQGSEATNAPNWTDIVYLSDDSDFDPRLDAFLTSARNVSWLASGESYAAVVHAVLPRNRTGDLYLIAVADFSGQLIESSEFNNHRSVPIQVRPARLPDLAMTDVTAPDRAFSGTSMALSWRDRNLGPGVLREPIWRDGVYLSADSLYDAEGDLRLGTAWHLPPLPADSSAAGIARVTLPDSVFGDRWLIFVSDDRNGVEEVDEAVNNRVARPITITLTPPPDLVPVALSAPATGRSGQRIDLSWTVRNDGAGPLNGRSWSDRVTLAPRPGADRDSVFVLGSFPRSAALAPDSAYARTASVTLPDGISGPWALLLHTDWDNRVFEYTFEDNNVHQADIDVTLSPWPDLRPAFEEIPAAITAFDQVGFRWNVENAGTAAAPARWVDRLFISPSAAWDSTTARPLAAAERTVDLDPGVRAATDILTRIPPDLAAGTYYLYLSADDEHRVYEHTDEANNRIRSGPVLVRALPVDLVPRNVEAPASAASGTKIAIRWDVANAGTGTTLTGEWADAVYHSDDAAFDATDRKLGVFPRSGHLDAGGTYTRAVEVRIPDGLSGPGHLLVVTDVNGAVLESNDGNNTAGRDIAVTLTPPADLVVSGITIPTAATAGQPLSFTRTIRNAGVGPTVPAGWYDAVLLSRNAVADRDDVRLGTLHHAGALAAGGSFDESGTVFLPAWAAGNYYLLVTADVRDDVYEAGQESNNTGAVLLSVNVPPPTDLVVTDVEVEPVAVPGDSVTITWTLKNTGTFPAQGIITDGIHVSADSAWTIEDPLVGLVDRSILILGGEARTMSARVSLEAPEVADPAALVRRPLPGLVPGRYRAIVRTNIRNTVRETDLANNRGVSADSVDVGIPLLPFDTPVAATIRENGMRYWRLEVPESGRSIAIRVDGLVPASNELYVRDGLVPTRSVFDHAGDRPFDPDQAVVIPGSSAGDTYIMVFSDKAPPEGTSFTVTAHVLRFGVDTIEPSEGGAGGRVTLAVSGSGMIPDIDLKLENGASRLSPVATRWIDATRVYATFDLSGVAPGTWDLRARQVDRRFDEVDLPDTLFKVVADSGDVVLPAAFRVVPATPPRLDIRRSGQRVVRIAHGFEMTVELTNLSNNDMQAPLLRVFADPDYPKGLEGGNGLFNGPRLFLATSPEGPLGVLRPGRTARIAIAGLAPDAPALLHIGVETVESGAVPFDFDKELRRAGVDPLHPLWSEAVDALRARKVRTWSDYRALLAETADSRRSDVGMPREAEDLLMLALENEQARILYPELPPVPTAGELSAARSFTDSFAGDASGRAVDDRPLDPASHVPPDCSALTIVKQFRVLSGVSSAMPLACAPVGAFHLDRFLFGSGATQSYGPQSYVASRIRSFEDAAVSFRSIHDYVTGQLRNQLEAFYHTYGCDATATPSFQFDVPKPSFYEKGSDGGIKACRAGSDLQMAFGGMQRASAEVTFLETNIVPFNDCQEGCVINYAAVIRYQFGDNYEFDKTDVRQGRLDAYGHNLQSCGKATPYKTEVTMLEPAFGRVVVVEEDECEDPERPDDPWDVNVVASVDPNDITGPPGAGDGRWVARSATFPYRIRYENDPKKATAPAQTVTVTQTLDGDLDPRSFRLGPFGFGSFTFAPPPGSAVFESRLDVRDSLGVFVDVTAGIDIVRGEVFWILQSIDPLTGATPEDPLAGFLPPNDDAGRGDGFMTYTIRPKATTRTGDRVDALARIVFDRNEPIDTPEIFNTIDADPPKSRVTVFSADVDTTRFTVTWTGGDSTGSGVGTYALYRSVDGGPFHLYRDGIAGKSLDVSGETGHVYGFYAQAVDRTGNREGDKAAAEATVRVVPRGGAPAVFAVPPNSPNPFRTSTVLPFDLPRPGRVEVRVYDAQGRLVMSRFRGLLPAGAGSEEIGMGSRASGIYFAEVRVTFEDGSQQRGVRKIVLAK